MRLVQRFPQQMDRRWRSCAANFYHWPPERWEAQLPDNPWARALPAFQPCMGLMIAAAMPTPSGVNTLAYKVVTNMTWCFGAATNGMTFMGEEISRIYVSEPV